MTETITNALIYETLKKVQEGQAELKHELRATKVELQEQITRTHEQFHEAFGSLKNQIHELHGDILRLDRRIGNMETRLERLERRTGLTEV